MWMPHFQSSRFSNALFPALVIRFLGGKSTNPIPPLSSVHPCTKATVLICAYILSPVAFFLKPNL